MSVGAMVFMASSWALVLGLTFWSYARVLRAPGRPTDEERERSAPGSARRRPGSR